MIPYGKQSISEKDIDEVVSVLKSDFITQGPLVSIFEEKVAEYCGTKHAVAFNSATSALHVACLALGVGPHDIVWTSPVTFVASANCALYCGAKIDFVDICPKTYNLCPVKLEQKLQQAEETGTLPKVVIPVHLAGQPCDMESIHSLSRKFGFRIIEDASHAIGGKYKGQSIGNCAYSDITVFSFHPVKIITTAEGGMAMTNRNDLATAMNLYRSHGITRDQDKFELNVDQNGVPLYSEDQRKSSQTVLKSTPSWYYQQITLGFNFRMTELQAALGISQLGRLDEFVQRRHLIAQHYERALSDLPLIRPYQSPDSYSSYHLYIIKTQKNIINTRPDIKLTNQDIFPDNDTKPDSNEKYSYFHRNLFDSLRSNGIGVNLHYIPIHTQPYFRKMGFKWGDFPIAENYYQSAISLPIYFGLTDQQQQYIIQTLIRLFKDFNHPPTQDLI